ncbi:MAG: tail fiber domain-containing protein [Acidobacteria bacterium]|nr:tail fiber domain-containing protein [Acidobacteriota bacterium]
MTGNVTASTFTGSGAGLTNVNAATLGGNLASFFATTGANTFSGNQAINGLLTATTSTGTAATINRTTAGSILDAQFNGSSRLNLSDTLLSLKSIGTASPASGADSVPIEIVALSLSSATSLSTQQRFSWQAQSVANNTASPSGRLALLYGLDTTPSSTGLSINPDGTFNFASGQTFPGTGGGTITAVNTAAGSGLQGGVSSGAANLSLLTCANGQVLKYNSATWACAADDNSGGTVTSITAGAGLTGGTISSSGTIAANFTAAGGDNGSTSLVARGDHLHDARYLQLTGGTLTGGLTATTFTGNGAALTNVNALTLAGNAASFFATTGANSFTGNQSVTGGVTATAFFGDGAALSNVNAVTLGGNAPGFFATTGANSFTGDQSVTGNVTANLFTGSGAGLSSVNAATLGGNAASFFATTGANSFTGNQSVTGSVTATSLLGDGTGLSNVNAVTLGGNAPGFFATTGSNTFIGNQIVSGSILATAFAGDGSNLTNLDAANIANGTISDARLSSNVALRSGSNTFLGDQSIAGTIVAQDAIAITYANDGTTGTSQNKLAKLNSSAQVVLADTSDAGGVIGVVTSGAGTSGNASISVAGAVSCSFDGPTTAGDYVQISSTIAGACHDSGPIYPSNGQVVGRALSTNASAGSYQIGVIGPEVRGGSGGGGTITAVNTGAGSGLQGGTNLGVANLALIPCATGQVLKYNSAAWVCDNDIDTNSGGTVTSVTAGAGLIGGTISASGTLSLDTTFTDALYLPLSGGTLFGNLNGSSASFSGGLTLGGNLISSGFRVVTTSATPNIIGGAATNSVTAGVIGGTVSGGGNPAVAASNTVTDDFGFVGGGQGNRAGDNSGTTSDRAYATVAGGNTNTASGFGATVGGGVQNEASGLIATIAGGAANTATAPSSAIGGGSLNLASGSLSTVPGGENNVAAGQWSFAAGRDAQALHDGAFVWGDSTGATVASGVANEFVVRASGGVRFRNAGGNILTMDGSGNVTANSFTGGGAGLTGVNASTFAGNAPSFFATTGANSFTGNQSVTGAITASGNTTASRFISTIATGTAPFAVASSSVVTNLNADFVDGLDSSQIARIDAINFFASAQTIAGGLNVASSTLSVDSVNNRVGIGLNSPGEKLEVSGFNATVRVRNFPADQIGSFIGSTAASMQLGLYNPQVSTQNGLAAGQKLSVLGLEPTGKVGSLTNNFGALAYRNVLDDGAGNMVATGSMTAASYVTSSSRRFKTNIHPLTGALGLIERLQGVTYNRRSDGRNDVGFIAEEVGAVLPEVVAFEENGVDAKGLDYARLTAVLVEAVKEQQKQIRALQQKIINLEKAATEKP